MKYNNADKILVFKVKERKLKKITDGRSGQSKKWEVVRRRC